MKRISFETAMLARSAGFYLLGPGYDILGHFKVFDGNPPYPAPYQAELQDWLRTNHGIHILIDFALGWGYQLIPVGWHGKRFSQEFVDGFKATTYEEGLKVGLQEALKIVSNENVHKN